MIEELKIDQVVPYGLNPRKHSSKQVQRIAESIEKFGFNQPLVVDENNVLLVGHGRLLAAKLLKLDSVPVKKVNKLTEQQKKAYRILDNKLQNDSEWDTSFLEMELKLLEGEGFDLKFCGLDELSSLFPEETTALKEDDFSESDPKNIYVKLGDRISLGEHILYCLDCREIPHDFIADLLITDPPYGVSYVGKTKEALKIENDSLSEEELSKLWSEALDNGLELLKEGGSVYVAAPPGPLHSIFLNSLIERKVLRQCLIWNKDSMVLGRSDYHYKHEPILYGWKPGASHYFCEDRSKTTILNFDRPKASKEHPTMKPVLLWEELIQNSSKPGDLVLDLFVGSGTTIIACEQLGRKAIGSELDPKYCSVIIDRYKKFCEANKKEFVCTINGEPFNLES